MRYQVYRGKLTRKWRWRLLAENNDKIANGGQGYFNLVDCLHGIELSRTGAGTPINIEGQDEIYYTGMAA